MRQHLVRIPNTTGGKFSRLNIKNIIHPTSSNPSQLLCTQGGRLLEPKMMPPCAQRVHCRPGSSQTSRVRTQTLRVGSSSSPPPSTVSRQNRIWGVQFIWGSTRERGMRQEGKEANSRSRGETSRAGLGFLPCQRVRGWRAPPLGLPSCPAPIRGQGTSGRNQEEALAFEARGSLADMGRGRQSP